MTQFFRNLRTYLSSLDPFLVAKNQFRSPRVRKSARHIPTNPKVECAPTPRVPSTCSSLGVGPTGPVHGREHGIHSPGDFRTKSHCKAGACIKSMIWWANLMTCTYIKLQIVQCRCKLECFYRSQALPFENCWWVTNYNPHHWLAGDKCRRVIKIPPRSTSFEVSGRSPQTA